MADQAKKLQVDVIARIDKLEKAMRKAAQVTDTNMGKVEGRAQTMVVRLDQKLAGVGKSFAIGVGGGVLAALAPMALFQKAIDDIGKAAGLQRLADRIGLSTTSLQALQLAAVGVGINVDQMGDGLGDFAAKVAEAASGAGPLAQIFKANGVELKNQNGTLRSTRDILGDFANLIQNAATPQEQLFLAQQAFGDEAAKMVPLFKNGARGIEQLEINAKAAGGTIDEELVKRAEELDRRMASMWQTFSTRSASAILTAVQAMDGLLAKLASYEQRKAAADLGTLAGSLVGKPGDVLTTGKADKPNSLDARMAGTLAPVLDAADQKLVDALQARYGQAAAKATVIPAAGGSGGSNGAMKEKLDLAQRVIENLEHERSLIGLTGVELEKQNAIWAAGKDATAAQRQEISQLVDAIYSANEAWEAQQDALEEARDAAREFTGDLINGLLEGKDASEVLSNALKRIGSQLINSGLDGLFGGFGGGGGFLSSLLGGGGKSFNPTPGGFAQMLGIPGYASGTNFHPGGMAIVGERGPELLNLPRGAQVMPRLPQMPAIASGGGGGAPVINISTHIDASGADPAAIARLEAGQRKRDAELPGKVVAAMRDARRRNVNF